MCLDVKIVGNDYYCLCWCMWHSLLFITLFKVELNVKILWG